MDRKDIDCTRNFHKHIMALIAKLKDENNKLIPFIIGDWNKEYNGPSTSNKLCNKLGLVNNFNYLYPNQKQFKTYIRGLRKINFALAPREIVDKVTNIVYKPFMYCLKGDHHAFYFDINKDILFQNKTDPPFKIDGCEQGLQERDKIFQCSL